MPEPLTFITHTVYSITNMARQPGECGIQEVLFHVGKIVEGATSSDLDKVLAYTQHLQARLEAAGEGESAERLSQILGKTSANPVRLARANCHRDPLPVDSESRLPMADEEIPVADDVPIFLPDRLQIKVDRFLAYVNNADRLAACGVGVSPSLLLYGPPGCGKTQLARHLSARLNIPIITARMDGLISSYLGSTAKNLRLLFEYAARKPSILFLDELDSLGKMRDDSRELGELKRVVISLLQNIDAISNGHIIVGATNHEHLLDPALWRRFAHRIQIGLPSMEERRLIARNSLRNYAREAQVLAVAALSEGLSGAILRQISEDSVRDAVIGSFAYVSSEEILNRLIEARGTGEQSSKLTLAELLLHVRAADNKVFTQSMLAELFGISQPRVSKLLQHNSRK